MGRGPSMKKQTNDFNFNIHVHKSSQHLITTLTNCSRNNWFDWSDWLDFGRVLNIGSISYLSVKLAFLPNLN